MIDVKLYCHNDQVWRFKIEGHARYAEHGSDVICAAISILVFNTINSITEFTDEILSVHAMDSTKGLFDCEFPKRKEQYASPEAELLLKSMILGIKTIQETYGKKYIKIHIIRR